MKAALPAALVVFGASGFVGRNLVEAVTGRVERLIGVTASGRQVPGCDTTVALSHLADIPALPDDTIVLHLAAYRYDAGRFDLAQSDILTHNLALNAAVFHFCAERKLRELRMASSVAVYPATLDVMDDAVPLDLDGPPHANESFYAWSKRMAEISAGLYAARFGLNTIAFRLSNPYGPHDSLDPGKSHVAPAFVMKALAKEPTFPIRGDPGVERDFVYVGDVVNAFLLSLARRGQSDAYNLASGRTTTLQTFAETVLRVAGIDKPIVAGAPGAFGPAVRRSTADRIQRDFGISFASLEDGLRPTIEWYRHAFQP